jgi:hypothetical protein
MVSARCTSRSLLNHCKQINKPKDLTVEYLQRKDFKEELDLDYSNNKLEWVCVVSFGGNKFLGCHLKKRDSLISALEFAEPHLKNIIYK